MLAERLQRLNGGCEHSEEVGGAFQQWQQRSPPLMQIFTSAACRLLFITGENVQLMVVTVEKPCFVALSKSVIMLFVSVVISMEINRRHYFDNKAVQQSSRRENI